MPLFIPFGESPFMYVSINKPLSGLGWRVKANIELHKSLDDFIDMVVKHQ